MDVIKKLRIGEAVTIIVAILFLILSGYCLLVLPVEYHIWFPIFMVLFVVPLFFGREFENERKEVTKKEVEKEKQYYTISNVKTSKVTRNEEA